MIGQSTDTPQDPEIKEVGPRIMAVLAQRLEALFMELSLQGRSQSDPVMTHIPALVKRAREIAGTGK